MKPSTSKYTNLYLLNMEICNFQNTYIILMESKMAAIRHFEFTYTVNQISKMNNMCTQ